MGDLRISGVVLAGGKSKRMGQNKALLELGNCTMIEKVVSTLQMLFQEIIVVTNTPEDYGMLKDVRFVEDQLQSPVKSSLIGLYSGLLAATNPYIFATACDMPLLNTTLIGFMRDQVHEQDIIIPRVKGYYEPLHAFYSKKCIVPIKRQLDGRDYKILKFFPEVRLLEIQENVIRRYDPHLHSFLNINNLQEYLAFKDTFLYGDEF